MERNQALERYAQRTRLSEEEVLGMVQRAMYDGRLLANYQLADPILAAGGTNLCPNSDFSWSHLAATVPGTSPANTSDDNKRCFRVFRQAVGADISTTGLRIAGAGSGEESTVYIPVWNKSLGVASIGADNISNNYDIAFKFENNWVVPAKVWYVRVALATAGATPPPAGLKLFVGFWVDDGVDQDWIRDTGFPVSVQRNDVPVAGANSYEYKVIARTDAGIEIGSAVVTVNDVGTLSPTNYLLISFYGASGYLEFETYRKHVASGQTHLIDFQRNSSDLSVVDQGQSLRVAPNGFPSSPETDTRAYSEVLVNALPITSLKTFHDLTIRIPNYDMSALVSEGTYLRIGLTGATVTDRQIHVDTVWAAETFNRWSPSPNDGYGSLPSVAITTGVGTGQSNTPPPTGGGFCVDIVHDLLLDAETNHYTLMKDITDEGNLQFYNGVGKNTIDHVIDGEVSQFYRILFSHGLTIRCTPSHRFIRSLDDGTGISAYDLEVGTNLVGVRQGVVGEVQVDEIELVQGRIKVRAIKVRAGSNPYYVVGDGGEALYVFSHNLKSDVIV